MGEFELGPEHVPELIRMATDEELQGAESESPEVWAPLQAWRVLGQLRAGAAVEPLLGLLDELEDDDWALEELPVVLGMIGRSALHALTAYLMGAEHDLWATIAAARAIAEIAHRDPSARDEAVRTLTKKLEWYPRYDPDLNGFLISYLVDLNATEAAPLIERAFAADAVDLSVMGDWEDVQVRLGLLEARQTPRPPFYPWFEPTPPARQAETAPGRRAAKAKPKARRTMARASRERSRQKRSLDRTRAPRRHVPAILQIVTASVTICKRQDTRKGIPSGGGCAQPDDGALRGRFAGTGALYVHARGGQGRLR